MVNVSENVIVKDYYVKVDLIGYRVGGVIFSAYKGANIESSYFIGTMDSVNSDYRKGLVYLSSAIVTNSYWDTTISGVTTTTDGGTGLTTTQFQDYMNTKSLPGFDFDTIWQVQEGSPYPGFQIRPTSGGEGLNSNITLTGDIKPLLASITIPTANLNDVLPDTHINWDGLGKEQSKDIALALVSQVSSSWASVNEEPLYVADTVSSIIGVLKSNSQVDFNFSALHGASFAEALAPEYRLVFLFDLK